MEPEAVLNLFDSIWFHLGILEKQQKPSISSPHMYSDQIQQNSSKQKNSSQMSLHTRSKSDQLSVFTTEILSPESVLKPHLQTILSGREISSELTPKTPRLKKPAKRVDRRKKRLSKSLSELEFEEVKGFIDLGFIFSEEDKDSNLVEIIPGLQKLGQKRDSHDQENEEERENIEESSVVKARPYLSEAWEFFEYRQMEEKMLMMKWRVPLPAATNEMDMKISLKSWAHTVASAVR
ncbi:hypothetical protein C2S52_003505 [Perilla frutescens var. hirtella]|uniref:Uncharacterized protein n=1 Tax=Perilla frutescens var. hirtella TaxID=608512 RepID=A0AAD4P6W5_PERFH|nr:hypothetical protein C2S51_012002 [Perilla frutescens var. frutescens]KAH6793028.1 hypothetical protein C2S52_003505 [Perilla frutescens var. hirtella]KAH6829179.1 hypothetical protein C2S53_016348 [Perilla frutescens var. hirtella]